MKHNPSQFSPRGTFLPRLTIPGACGGLVHMVRHPERGWRRPAPRPAARDGPPRRGSCGARAAAPPARPRPARRDATPHNWVGVCTRPLAGAGRAPAGVRQGKARGGCTQWSEAALCGPQRAPRPGRCRRVAPNRPWEKTTAAVGGWLCPPLVHTLCCLPLTPRPPTPPPPHTPQAATTPAPPAAAPATKQHPIPLAKPIYLGLRAIYNDAAITSIFYDSAASDDDDDDARRVTDDGIRIAAIRRRAPGSDDGSAAAAAAAAATGIDLPVAPSGAHAGDADARARVRAIRKAIVAAGDDLRSRHPWLEPAQDAIGLALILGGIAINVGVAVAFARGAIGWLPSILIAAFVQSILHEVEHDLIHGCYFLRRCGPAAVNAALAAVYTCRLSTINPWSRRKLHINHHVASGTKADLEERAITNGQPWSLVRLLLTGDNALAVMLRPMASLRELRDYVRTVPEADPCVNPAGFLAARSRMLIANAGGYVPGGVIHYGIWYAALVDAAATAAGVALFGAPGVLGGGGVAAFARIYAAAFGAPNFLRTFCLHFISSNVHYVGIGRGDVLNQTQVLTTPLLAPFQAFCFNFGGTHAIHHFVVRDTFYIRQAIAPTVLPVMRANGVRFNDLGTFARANRLPEDGKVA